MTRIQARASAAISGACVLIATSLLLVPVQIPSQPVELGATMPDTTVPGLRIELATPGEYLSVVEENLLSQTRAGPEISAEPLSPPTPSDRAPTSPRRRYRLSGIVQGPDGIVALIDADRTIPGAELYRLGDRVGPYRIVEATDSVIVLQGAGEIRVLRLQTLPGRSP